MPGIYVPTLSQYDWLDQERESILNIPGSYWLCHRKNIYKFILRYHRTVKNTMQFLYGRELWKIIRRIIKCHPSQGQQFGTQHLLVTYNCTSWTRQDKMFAILKFQQRTNAAAFSHAFVLTIRICPSSEESLFNMRYPIVKEADVGATFQGLNVSLDTEEKNTKSLTCSADQESSKKMEVSETKILDKTSNCNVIDDTSNKILETIASPNFQNSVATNSANCEISHERMENIATTVDVHVNDKPNTELFDVCEDESVHSNIENKHFTEKKSLEACKRIHETEIKDTENKKIILTEIKKQTQETLNKRVRKYKIFSATKPPITGIIQSNDNEWSLLDRFNFVEDSIQRNNVCAGNNNEDNSNAKKVTNKSIIDPLKVPYQFTEKDIEKHDILLLDHPSHSQTTIKNVNEDIIQKRIKTDNDTSLQNEHRSKIFDSKSKGNDEQQSNTQTLLNNQSQNNILYNKSYKVRKQKTKESEKKIIPEDKILRSSNITDLVMEGLMFTIKQDKDSVAVIEQKTKLEMDEVLENSEKVETKAGEKCLINSSLLRLENLVTMIDSPREKQNKTGHATRNSTHLLPLHSFASVHNLKDTYCADRKLDKLDVFSYNRYHGMDDLTSSYRSRWHQRISSDINKTTNLSVGGDVKESEQLMECQDSDNEQTLKDEKQMGINETKRNHEEEDEDIIPETPPSILFSETIGLQNIDLLMDDVEDFKQTDKDESPLEKCSELIEMRTTKLSAVPERKSQNVSIKEKLNFPRVVSDKVVTVEQMSPALQKVLRHTYEKRKFSPATVSSEASQHKEKIQDSANEILETSISSLEDEHVNSNIPANKSLKINPEETEFDKNESSMKTDKAESTLKINKDIPETKDRHTRSAKRRNSSAQKTHRFSRRNSAAKQSSPRKLQDITEDFYYDLMQHAHNKDNTIRQRCLRQKRRSLDNPDDVKNGKVRIEMLKFIQDITEGVRVVVKRLDMNSESSLLKKNSMYV